MTRNPLVPLPGLQVATLEITRRPSLRWPPCAFPDRPFRHLDGTVVDSGAIILASMRHATREVLGREYTDAELMHSVGGPGSRRRWPCSIPTRSPSSSRLPRAQRAAPRGARGMRRDGGGAGAATRGWPRLGIVTANVADRELAFAPSRSATFRTIVGGDETERHKPDSGAAPAWATRLGAEPRRPRTSATRRSTSAQRRLPACTRSR